MLRLFSCFRCFRFLSSRRAFQKDAKYAKQKITLTFQYNPERPTNGPKSGFYQYTYLEGYKALPATVYLTFEVAPRGWSIAGHGKDRDGPFFVREGLVSNNGAAYWVITSKHSTKQKLSVGIFHFQTNEFQGRLQTSIGEFGRYESFTWKESQSPSTETENDAGVDPSGNYVNVTDTPLPPEKEAFPSYSPPPVPSVEQGALA